MMCTQLNYIR